MGKHVRSAAPQKSEISQETPTNKTADDTSNNNNNNNNNNNTVENVNVKQRPGDFENCPKKLFVVFSFAFPSDSFGNNTL